MLLSSYRLGGYTVYRDSSERVQPRLSFMSEQAVRQFHLAAIHILEKTGVVVHHRRVVELLGAAGCEVAENRVRIPGHLVEQAIRSAPASVAIYDREGRPAMNLEAWKSYWGPGSDTPFVLDSFTGKRRQTCLEDVKRAAVLVDHLANFDFLMCMGVAHELPSTIADKRHFVTMVDNTTKPLVFTASSLENLKDIHRMASQIAGGEETLRSKPFIIHYTEPVAPLIHPRDSLEKLLYCVENEIPVVYTSATTAAQNGPALLAGSLAMSNARILSGLVIGQLANKGAKMIVTMHASSMDPRTGIHTYASPEHVLCQAAARGIAESYGLPTFGRAGTTDAKLPDQQAAFEAGYEILMHALSGENLIHDVGYIESGLTASWDAMVICDELIGAVKRIVRGFEVGEASLCLDLIDQIGPEGHFMAEPHTAENFRKEFWIPQLLDRSNYIEWEERGSTTLLDRARARVKEILATHASKPLDEKMKSELERLAAHENT